MAITVPGVELEPGERVLVWRVETGHGGKVAAMIVLGGVLAIGVIGLLFLYMAVTYKKRTTYAELVTDRRFVHVKGDGRVVSVPYNTITKVTTIRQGAITKEIHITSNAEKSITIMVTTVTGPDRTSIKLPDFLSRRDEPGFLASLVPTGRAAA